MSELTGLGAAVAVLASQGRSIAEIARQFEAQGVPPATTLFYWRRWRQAERRICRAQRDREIMRLAALGLPNKHIGARVRLHPKSVSRIVRREIARLAA